MTYGVNRVKEMCAEIERTIMDINSYVAIDELIFCRAEVVRILNIIEAKRLRLEILRESIIEMRRNNEQAKHI